MRTVAFDVPQVYGKGRPKFSRRGHHAYTPKKTVDAEKLVRECFVAQALPQAEPEDFPIMAGDPHNRNVVHVYIETTRPMPKGTPKKYEEQPDAYKFDADNIIKTILDALNGVAWQDDNQVTAISIQKLPRTRETTENAHVEITWGLTAQEERALCQRRKSLSATPRLITQA